MNKKLIIVGGIILVLVLGGAGFLVINQNKSGETTNPTSSSQSTEQKSLKDLMGLGSSQECSFTDVQIGSSGKVYVGSGKFSGEFNSQVDGKVTVSHMVADGTNVYFWVEGQTQGFKTSQASVENVGGAEVKESLDVNAKAAYSCKPWVVTTTQFDLPSNVTFTDYSNLIPSPVAVPSGGSGVQPNCSACASLTGDSKTQCLTALKCN